jgi:hypothetical protein
VNAELTFICVFPITQASRRKWHPLSGDFVLETNTATSVCVLVFFAVKMSSSETEFIELEDSSTASRCSYAIYYDSQVRLLEAEIAEYDVCIDLLKRDDKGRRVANKIGTCLNEACNKKAKLLYQKFVMKSDRDLLLDEMAFGRFEAAI